VVNVALWGTAIHLVVFEGDSRDIVGSSPARSITESPSPPQMPAAERGFSDFAVLPTRYQCALTHELIIRWSLVQLREREAIASAFNERFAEEVERLDAEKLLEFGFIGKNLAQGFLGHLA
jgi:hypothetical protein